MARYAVTPNDSETSGRHIEAYELLLDGNVAKFRDSNSKIIALYSVKKFHIKLEEKD